MSALPCPFEVCEAIPAPPPGSPEWPQIRVNIVGASEVAKVVNMSKFGQPVDLYHEKLGHVEPQGENIRTRLGNYTEPFIRDYYAELTGRRVWKPENVIYVSRRNRYMAASPDGLVEGPGAHLERGLECKHSSNPDIWGPSGSDSYPEDYFLQCQQNMAVTGLEVWDLAALLPRGDSRIYTILRDDTICDTLSMAITDFMERHVLAGVPPEVDYQHPSALELAKKLYPEVTDEVVELPAFVSDLIHERTRLAQKAKHYTDLAEGIKARLLLLMGNAGRATIEGAPFELTRKVVEKKPFTVTPKPYVDFRIKELK